MSRSCRNVLSADCAGAAALVLALLAASCSSSSSSTGPPPPSNVMTIVAGSDGQSAQVNTAVAVAPSVVVKTSSGAAVSGVSVTFSVTAGGGSVVGGSAVTNSSGIAAVTSWTLGTVAGVNTLTAASSGITSVNINATGTPGPAQTVTVTPGSFDLLPTNTQQLSVTVTDAYGNALPSPSLTYTPASTSVATVSTSGLVTAVAAGTTAITVTSGAASGTDTAWVLGHPSFGTIATTAETGRPFGVAVNKNNLVYVTELDNARLGQYQLPSQTLSGTTIAAGSVPTSVSFLPNGARAYVANEQSPSVGVIDVATHSQVTTIPLTSHPLRVLVSSDGGTVYVATDAGTVEVVNTTTNALGTPFTVAGVLNGIAQSPTQPLIYASSTTGTVYEINTSTRATRSFAMSGAPQDIAVSRDGNTLYIANENGPLEVRSASTLAQITTVSAATNMFGLTLTRDGTQLYAAGGGSLVVLDAVALTVAHSTSPGGSFRRIAFDHTGTTAVIGNESNLTYFVQ